MQVFMKGPRDLALPGSLDKAGRSSQVCLLVCVMKCHVSLLRLPAEGSRPLHKGPRWAENRAGVGPQAGISCPHSSKPTGIENNQMTGAVLLGDEAGCGQ